MGYRPPAGGGVVRVPEFGRTLELGTTSEPTTLEGSGVVIRPDADRLTFFAAAGEPALALNHYHHGAPPAADTIYRRWRNNRLVQSALGSVLEVWCGTAPSDVTGGHHGIRFAGTGGGSVDLELNVAGQQHYTLDLQGPTIIQDVNRNSRFTAMNQARGGGFHIGMDQDVELFGFEFVMQQSPALGVSTRRFGVTDELGNIIVYTDVRDSYAISSTNRIQFPYSVTLEAGRTYFLFGISLDGGRFYNARGIMAAGGLGQYIGGEAAIHYTAPEGITIADCIGAGDFPWDGWPDRSNPVTQLYGIAGNNGPVLFSLLGRTAGFSFVGDITATAIVTGTPPAAPADLNVRVEIAPAE